MVQYLADTWLFVARIDPFDSHHRAALQLDLRHQGRLVTHDAVLTEFLSYFSARGATLRAEAVRVVRETALRFLVVPSDRALFSAALKLYERRLDKKYSLVDCMSMIVMRERGITHVLTNDHHFQQEGFTVVNA